MSAGTDSFLDVLCNYGRSHFQKCKWVCKKICHYVDLFHVQHSKPKTKIFHVIFQEMLFTDDTVLFTYNAKDT